MIYTTEVQHMCPVAKGAYHGPAPIPEEGKWVQAKQIGDISGFTHGIGWCAPQQGDDVDSLHFFSLFVKVLPFMARFVRFES